MKFVLAPDSFKECMTSVEASDIMEKSIKKIIPEAECIKIPMADGGEGTVEALTKATNGKIYEVTALDPLSKTVYAKFGVLGNEETAVIEMASASGIQLVKTKERNPMLTTTYGTGQLIKYALDRGVKRIIIGIGGSATNDGGAGMIQALGGKLLTEDGEELPRGGGSLNMLRKIDLSQLDSRIKDVHIEVACDVTNPLTGIEGASYVFSPQKGASDDMVEILDNNLKHYARIIKDQLGIDVDNISGSGAAGGLGAGLMAFLGAKLTRGVDLVIKYTGIEEIIKDCDFIFTGEGSIDGQTLYGKVPIGLSNIAMKYHKPLIAFTGRVGEEIDCLYEQGITAIFGILSDISTKEKALEMGKSNLSMCCENVVRMIKINNK